MISFLKRWRKDAMNIPSSNEGDEHTWRGLAGVYQCRINIIVVSSNHYHTKTIPLPSRNKNLVTFSMISPMFKTTLSTIYISRVFWRSSINFISQTMYPIVENVSFLEFLLRMILASIIPTLPSPTLPFPHLLNIRTQDLFLWQLTPRPFGNKK